MHISLHLNKKNIFLSLILAFFVLGGVGLGVQGAGAAGVESAIDGLNTSAGKGFLGSGKIDPKTDQGIMTSIPKAIGKILGAGLSLIGVLFLILMIYAGFRWMLARGNETEVEKAKHLIEAAIAGLIIVITAYAITIFVGEIIM